MLFSAHLEIEPTAKGRPKFTKRGHAYTPEKTKAAEELLQLLFRKLYKGKPLEQALMLYLFFMIKKPKSVKNREFPIVKPDLDNMQKLVCDAGNGILWMDDSQIVQVHVAKVYTDVPGVVIGVNQFTLEDLTALLPVFDLLTAHEGQFLANASSSSLRVSSGGDPGVPQ